MVDDWFDMRYGCEETRMEGVMLVEKIREDMMAAKKAQNKISANLLSTLYAEAISVGRRTENRLPTDSETIAVVKKFIGNTDETIGHLTTRG